MSDEHEHEPEPLHEPEPVERQADLPSARTGNGTRAIRAIAIAAAFAIAVVSVFAGRAYKRPDPVANQPSPGMKVGSGSDGVWSVTLEPTAPQWSVVMTRAPDKPEPRWTEPIPARVVFDESRTSRLGAPLAGRVSAVMVERGQSVKAGAPLYTVTSAGLADLQSAVKVAEVELETAKKNFNRTQDAVNAQVLPGKDLDAARTRLKQAEVADKLAKQKVGSLKVSSGDASFTVTAPRSGVVVERTVAIGMTVSPDTGSLIAIADLSSVWVVVDVFGSHLAGLAPGGRVRVTIGDAERDAAIDQISAVVDPDRHAVPVRIKLDNLDGLLRPNAYVQVRLFDPSPTLAMLPAAAVMSDGSKSFVYLENPKGVLKRRDIEVGSVIGGRVPVTAGLTLDDRVVVQGAILLDNEIALDN